MLRISSRNVESSIPLRAGTRFVRQSRPHQTSRADAPRVLEGLILESAKMRRFYRPSGPANVGWPEEALQRPLYRKQVEAAAQGLRHTIRVNQARRPWRTDGPVVGQLKCAAMAASIVYCGISGEVRAIRHRRMPNGSAAS